ncbi:MAG: hypothetical protein NT007_16485 [Candidatus Kapabacteria bacterium]|nr:hypothetical protein [Candidatus Kapabacteria bacterium]
MTRKGSFHRVSFAGMMILANILLLRLAHTIKIPSLQKRGRGDFLKKSRISKKGEILKKRGDSQKKGRFSKIVIGKSDWRLTIDHYPRRLLAITIL